MVDTGCTPKEAYEAVPQLHQRGENCIQNIRKRAREKREQLDEAAAAPAKKKAKPKKVVKPKRLLPKGKRLRPDKVDAIAAEKVAKRQRRSAAHKAATNKLAEAIEGSSSSAAGPSRAAGSTGGESSRAAGKKRVRKPAVTVAAPAALAALQERGWQHCKRESFSAA